MREGSLIWFYLFLGAIVLAILLLQVVPYLRTRRQEGKPAPELDEYLGPQQRAQPQLLFYFGSPSCAPCASVSRAVEALQAERNDIVKVDVSSAPELARAFGIMATPTLVLVRHGIMERVLLGVQSEGRIRALLEEPGGDDQSG